MNSESSASSMVVRQIHVKSSQLTHDLEQSGHVLKSKSPIRIRSSKKKSAINIEEMSPRANNDKLPAQTKQAQKYFMAPSKQQSYSHFHPISDEKHTPLKLGNFIANDKIQNASSHKKRSVILLSNILQPEPYVKRLMAYLPKGNYCMANVLRENNVFSTDVKLTIKGDEMIKAKKLSTWFSSDYQIVSQNQKENTLGYVRSNLSGSVFNVYQQNVLQEQRLVSTIWYEDSVSFRSGPRSVELYVLDPEQTVDELILNGQATNLKELYEQGNGKKINKLKNKEAEWRENGYCVDFGVSHVLPSIKNVILQDEQGNGIVGFYKIKPDEFELIAREGVSTFIAYCFALSSLKFKLACQ